ncbi:nucleoside recognition domain-containing protein [Candidatus Pyrohabitans sp.]
MSYILETLLYLCAGVVVANLLLEFGLTGYLTGVIRPFLAASHLSGEVAASALARMLSPSAGYSSLAEFHRRGEVSEKEVLLTTFLTSFPYELLRVPKFYLPVVVPLLGAPLAMKYMAIKLGSGFIQSFAALVYARTALPEREVVLKGEVSRGSLRSALALSLKTLLRVVPVFLGAYLAVQYLLASGMLEKLAVLAQPVMALFSLPGEAAIVIATQLANVIAGFAVAGEFLKQGVMGEREALITLIAGLVLSLPRIYAQHTLPVVASLFSRGMALRIILLKITFEAMALLVMLMVLL